MPTPDTITVDRTYIAGQLSAARDALRELLTQIQKQATTTPGTKLAPDELQGWQRSMLALTNADAYTNAWITLGVLDLFAKHAAGALTPSMPPQATETIPPTTAPQA